MVYVTPEFEHAPALEYTTGKFELAAAPTVKMLL
jgi:hypothetical protein